MLKLENDNKLMELRTRLERDEMTTRNNNEVKDIDTNRVNQLIGNYHDNKLNEYTNTNNKTKEIKRAKRCEIWYVNLGKRNGSIQSNIRPFLITSNSLNNQYSTIVNGFPITSKVSSKACIPVHVEIEGYGLKEKSLVLTEQITTIDVRYDLLTYVGTVDEICMKRIDNARNIQLGEMVEKSPLERLPQNIQDIINDKLEDIKGLERTITNITRETLIKHLMEEREARLLSLQRICEKYNLNYKDYYVMYRKEEIKSVM